MKKYFNLQLFETDAQIIDRSGAESLIPEDRAAKFIQGAIRSVRCPLHGAAVWPI